MAAKLARAERKHGGAPPLAPIQLDHRAYFLDFCKRHGGNPVEHKGRLIFADGWAYSATDYAGPEWRPPEDAEELRLLKLAYWGRRRGVVQLERRRLKVEYDAWVEAQQGRDGELLRKVVSRAEDGSRLRETRPVSLTAMAERLDWLEQDAAECERQIKNLKKVM